MQYYYHVYCIHPGKYLAQSTVILLKTETLISFSYCWARLTKIILYCSICTIFLDCKEQTVETHTEHRRSNDPLEQIPYVVIVTFLPQIEKKKPAMIFWLPRILFSCQRSQLQKVQGGLRRSFLTSSLDSDTLRLVKQYCDWYLFVMLVFTIDCEVTVPSSYIIRPKESQCLKERLLRKSEFMLSSLIHDFT